MTGPGGDDGAPLVTCLDCGRRVRSAVSRALRLGVRCRRERRALDRRMAAPVPLPGMPARAAQQGPDLMTTAGAAGGTDDPDGDDDA